MKILVLHGPNLNLLGEREPKVYGDKTLDDVNRLLFALASTLGITIEAYQSNHEGDLVDKLHETVGVYSGVIFNPGGYAHTSVVLHDAIKAISTPVIEVHMSNIYAREDFRHQSMIAPVCIGSISGFGVESYCLALYALYRMKE